MNNKKKNTYSITNTKTYTNSQQSNLTPQVFHSSSKSTTKLLYPQISKGLQQPQSQQQKIPFSSEISKQQQNSHLKNNCVANSKRYKKQLQQNNNNQSPSILTFSSSKIKFPLINQQKRHSQRQSSVKNRQKTSQSELSHYQNEKNYTKKKRQEQQKQQQEDSLRTNEYYSMQKETNLKMTTAINNDLGTNLRQNNQQRRKYSSIGGGVGRNHNRNLAFAQQIEKQMKKVIENGDNTNNSHKDNNKTNNKGIDIQEEQEEEDKIEQEFIQKILENKQLLKIHREKMMTMKKTISQQGENLTPVGGKLQAELSVDHKAVKDNIIEAQNHGSHQGNLNSKSSNPHHPHLNNPHKKKNSLLNKNTRSSTVAPRNHPISASLTTMSRGKILTATTNGAIVGTKTKDNQHHNQHLHHYSKKKMSVIVEVANGDSQNGDSDHIPTRKATHQPKTQQKSAKNISSHSKSQYEVYSNKNGRNKNNNSFSKFNVIDTIQQTSSRRKQSRETKRFEQKSKVKQIKESNRNSDKTNPQSVQSVAKNNVHPKNKTIFPRIKNLSLKTISNNPTTIQQRQQQQQQLQSQPQQSNHIEQIQTEKVVLSEEIKCQIEEREGQDIIQQQLTVENVTGKENDASSNDVNRNQQNITNVVEENVYELKIIRKNKKQCLQEIDSEMENSPSGNSFMKSSNNRDNNNAIQERIHSLRSRLSQRTSSSNKGKNSRLSFRQEPHSSGRSSSRATQLDRNRDKDSLFKRKKEQEGKDSSLNLQSGRRKVSSRSGLVGSRSGSRSSDRKCQLWDQKVQRSSQKQQSNRIQHERIGSYQKKGKSNHNNSLSAYSVFDGIQEYLLNPHHQNGLLNSGGGIRRSIVQSFSQKKFPHNSHSNSDSPRNKKSKKNSLNKPNFQSSSKIDFKKTPKEVHSHLHILTENQQTKLRNKILALEEKMRLMQQSSPMQSSEMAITTTDKTQNKSLSEEQFVYKKNEKQNENEISNTPFEQRNLFWRHIDKENNKNIVTSDFEKELKYISSLEEKNEETIGKYIENQKLLYELKIVKR